MTTQDHRAMGFWEAKGCEVHEMALTPVAAVFNTTASFWYRSGANHPAACRVVRTGVEARGQGVPSLLRAPFGTVLDDEGTNVCWQSAFHPTDASRGLDAVMTASQLGRELNITAGRMREVLHSGGPPRIAGPQSRHLWDRRAVLDWLATHQDPKLRGLVA